MQKEPVRGSARHAAWLAPGKLVVAGWDAATTFKQSGLWLLDTKTWSEELLHPNALLFYVRPHRLLTMAPGGPDCAASALTAYTLGGVELYRVCERRATGEIEFAGRYARLGRVDGRVAVVEVATGRVIARIRGIRVTPLATTLVQEP